jgi:tetratricopeptide (TPR) repeat protein|tara:strand:+ start:1807 stop:2751 length:945 start_codon:yes stop_codon:yes gene_type:complete
VNTATFTYLLANPQQLNDQQLADLETVISKYPYFQSARALQLKGLKNNDSFLYNDALKLTAAYTADRDILFQYITSDAFVQDKISEAILQHDASVNELEVEIEDVTEQTALELDKQLKNELKKAEAILNPQLFERKIASVKEISEEANKTPEPEAQIPNEADDSIEVTTHSEEIEPDAPLAFKKQDTHSFSEWLQLTRAQPIDRSEEKEEAIAQTPSQDEAIEKKFELIEKFIQDKPKLEVSAQPTKQIDLAEPYTQTPNALMTETLAKVYLQQKNYKKAIKAYEILILKNPEKSGFFADQIRAIKKLNTKEES